MKTGEMDDVSEDVCEIDPPPPFLIQNKWETNGDSQTLYSVLNNLCHSPQMAVQQRLLVRVIVTEADIRKVELKTKPDTVDVLIGSLKDALHINYNFSLQFKDPNFDNELCNLTEISELPEQPTLETIPVLSLVEVPFPRLTSSEELSDTTSQAQTQTQTSSPTLLKKDNASGQRYLICIYRNSLWR